MFDVFATAIASFILALTVDGAAAQRPTIAWNPIPYPAKRKAEMRSYSLRHYGLSRFGLHNPKVIVQHLTESSTYGPIWRMFAQDVPDNELNELPGVCSHFIIDQNGKIHQLVPISLMCRHTVGLNWTAIGIEHVGFKPNDVLGRRKVLAASLRLTNWLRCREGISVNNVIGHNESLKSPYHRERIGRLRSQTHDDFPTSSMRKYRAALRKLTC